MKIKKALVLAMLLFSLLALTATSQISQVTDTISIEKIEDCSTQSYEQVEHIHGYVTKTKPSYTNCYNTQNQSYYPCINGIETYQVYDYSGQKTVLKNKTVCNPKSFIVTINKSITTEKKEVDFSIWGVCIEGTEGECVTITCGTLEGGSARNGIFNGCDGGKQCQKFIFCEDSTKVLYKGSKTDFSDEDPTYHLTKLSYKEVPK